MSRGQHDQWNDEEETNAQCQQAEDIQGEGGEANEQAGEKHLEPHFANEVVYPSEIEPGGEILCEAAAKHHGGEIEVCHDAGSDRDRHRDHNEDAADQFSSVAINRGRESSSDGHHAEDDDDQPKCENHRRHKVDQKRPQSAAEVLANASEVERGVLPPLRLQQPVDDFECVAEVEQLQNDADTGDDRGEKRDTYQ
jgi:hypothetical protein